MPVGRYVLVSTDPADKVIKGGPILWDGEAPFTLPPGQQIMEESVATAGGYTYLSPPVAEINAASLRDRAAQALTANATYLAIPTPTNTQVVAQVNRLTKEASGLIRMVLNQVDDIAGT